MVYDSGLIVGRFQTFHKGHQSLVDAGLQLCDRVLILIGSAQESGTERNPYNISTRIDVIRSVYADSAEFIIPRSRLPISATMLREMMVKDERREWMKWVNPKLHKMYDRLRAELMEVPYYKELQKTFLQDSGAT